jgi:hypothetical protein
MYFIVSFHPLRLIFCLFNQPEEFNGDLLNGRLKTKYKFVKGE